MTDRIEAAMAMAAAILVLFTAMWDPLASAGAAIVLLVAFSIYKFLLDRKER